MSDKPIEEMTSDEISTVQVEKEKEFQKQNELQNKWAMEKLRLEKEIALLRIKHNEAKSVLTMSEGNFRRLRSEMKVLEKFYWKNKRG